VLSQLFDFIRPATEKDNDQHGIWISPKDIHDAIELDKMFYDKQDWDRWETSLLRGLHIFGFGIDDLKSKTKLNKYKLFMPKNIGQHLTIISDDQTPSEIVELILQ
jgi:hypothetical protein